jgi:hypothetical protein
MFTRLNVAEDRWKLSQQATKDPIKCFGVLVPGCLRKSQTEFQSGLHWIIEIANTVHKLRCLQEELKEMGAWGSALNSSVDNLPSSIDLASLSTTEPSMIESLDAVQPLESTEPEDTVNVNK